MSAETRPRPMGEAVRLTLPAAVAAGIAATFGQIGEGSLIAALGVACGALAGAATASVFRTWRVIETPRAEATAAPPPPEPPAVSDHLGPGRAALTAMPDALILLDAEGRVAFANPAAAARIGRLELGAHFSAALRASPLVQAVDDAVSHGADATLTFPYFDGQEHWLSASVAAIAAPEAPGEEPARSRAPSPFGPPKVLVLLRDQTRERRAEQLHRDFVANASHELKTPLASIVGFIETLQGPARDDLAQHERFLGIMAQQAARMRRLVEDLLSLNRIELNEHVAPRDVVDFSATLADAAAACASLHAARMGVSEAEAFRQIDLPPRDAVWRVRGERGELTQLFANLIDNALKYGGEKRPVEVRVRRIDDGAPMLELVVEDYGPGIAREHLPRLTERFYRVDTQASRDKGGTGLGLAIVKHIVARHRGRLEIDSDLGRGARVIVRLPIPIEAIEGADRSAGEGGGVAEAAPSELGASVDGATGFDPARAQS